jgi:hypothetical protein
MTKQTSSGGVALREIARCEGFRALTWAGDVLYASRGYALFRARVGGVASGKAGPSTAPSLRSGSGRDDNGLVEFERVASFEAPLWRRMTSHVRLAGRLVRDGFHALAVHPSGALVGAVPGAIVTCATGDSTFRVTHVISRGTRPLNIAIDPAGTFFWGEYFDNVARDAVHIYASIDAGRSWQVVYTFAKGAIRHVHNIVYDRWRDCLWILTGDYGGECRILRAKCDLSEVQTVLSGNQQARAVACIPAKEGLYFSTDTPLEQNFICRLSDNGEIARLAPISSSSIYACRTQSGMFFSAMVEPSEVNRDRQVRVYGSGDGERWSAKLAWEKDRWPMKFFQYGNAFLPSGENATDVLAVTTVAVAGADGAMSLYRANESIS